MILGDLIKNLKYIQLIGNKNIEVSHLTIDSRKVKKCSMYGAIKGFNVDGHKFIKNAIESGASLILCENIDNIEKSEIKDVAILQVKNTREALATIAKNFYNNATKDINLIGVTGTNGKTSTTYFLEQVLLEYKKTVGIIGTIEIRENGKKIDFDFATSTTPDTIELNELFSKMANNNVDNVVMEVSSHALELHKVDECNFNIGIFTNLTQDHLDMHKSMENYCNAKSKLFNMCKIGIINVDDKYAKEITKNASCKIFTYSIEKESDLQAINIQYFMDKVTFDVKINDNIESFILNIPGRFSVYNALGVIGACLMQNIPIDIIKQGIKSIKGVPGRIQTIPNDKGFNVIVDYAHTPDGLDNIIKAVREFTKGKVITIFGCGGDRDRKKRSIMGEISARLSDYTIVTSDNPRSEVPEAIIDEIELGIKPITSSYEKITGRREAIYRGVYIAKPNDSIIIAGKGHEDYEIFADRTIHFDDTEVAKEALEDL
ncbi:UDP-N-acetylmuramoyl-L-alanyl-D-glutamate--2,6-diaminopimelate ligase [uncultured Tyzzerella sp.]|uniref:UDP-N-acetylmuramoyl-L-alanyl-D-glutamate--2, 6-diaminopimelate ligase n=1 Tax=uncultured Tyzzerella sp. TaxID=2321398 RepID=UPI00294237D1|nr:UDP-N-acetylmuramoyl-L-alanyl-D-glutamate--2,6-diaminopimelate ligase [uncultured Tyzzerella sp.]